MLLLLSFLLSPLTNNTNGKTKALKEKKLCITYRSDATALNGAFSTGSELNVLLVADGGGGCQRAQR